MPILCQVRKKSLMNENKCTKKSLRFNLNNNNKKKLYFLPNFLFFLVVSHTLIFTLKLINLKMIIFNLQVDVTSKMINLLLNNDKK